MKIQRVRELHLALAIFVLSPLLSPSVAAQTPPPLAPPPDFPPLVLNWETGANKSYLLPAADITGFLVALNIFNRKFIDPTVYGTTARGGWKNFRELSLEYDDDPFTVNQFGHPAMGAVMYGAARSTGLSFWQSLVYSNAGSFVWEVAGETGPASFNDLITTAQAGSLLGETLFRMASLVLENGGSHPSLWRETAATALMPSLGFTRLLHGKRFRSIFPSHHPAVFWDLRFGASADEHLSDTSSAGLLDILKQEQFVLDFSFSYGAPGKPGYTYYRPFDYFQVDVGAMTSGENHNYLEHLFSRGLLWGRSYAGGNHDGIFGIYGTYDFASPQVFRISSTAVAVGTTLQWWIAPKVALQGTVLGGVGFAGAGTNPVKGLRDYHYGVTPQAMVALQLILGDRVALDFIGRGYYISGTGSDDTLGTETLLRAKAGLTVRVFDRNALGVQFVGSHRVSGYGFRTGTHQSIGTISLTYSWLGERGFGALGSYR